MTRDGLSRDLDADADEEAEREASAKGLTQLELGMVLQTRTTFILCQGLQAAGGGPRFDFPTQVAALDAVRTFAHLPGMTASYFKATMTRAVNRAAGVLNMVVGTMVRPSVGDAYRALILEVEGTSSQVVRNPGALDQVEKLAASCLLQWEESHFTCADCSQREEVWVE